MFAITSEVDESWAVRQIKLRYGVPIPIASKDSSFKYAISPLTCEHVKHILREEKPDVLHAFYVSNYGFLAAKTGFHPLIVTAWGSDILLNPEQHWILKRMIRRALQTADMVTTDSRRVQSKIVNLLIPGHSNDSKIYIIRCGTDVNLFKPEKRSLITRSEMGAAAGELIVISIRALEPYYDVRTLVKAAGIVLQSEPSIRFVVAGGGSERDVLENLAVAHGVFNNFRFVGELAQDEVVRYLASSDIYVSTALGDAGLASSTAEAMACRLPVIVSDVCDNKEFVTENVDGFLFPAGSYEALADRILSLVNNRFARFRMGAEGREQIVMNLNIEVEMGKMMQLYQSVGDKKK